MKKVFVLSMLLCFSVLQVFAGDIDIFDEFNNQLTGVSAEVAKDRLNNLAKDLGSLLGGGSFRSGKNIGFPGFDIGIIMPTIPISDEDEIIRAADFKTAPLPLLQASIGLPYGIDIIARYTTFGDSTLIGGGLKYKILDSWIPGIPFVSVQSVYNSLDGQSGANKLKADNLSTAAVASWKFLMVEPYVGLSYDMTSVKPDSSLNVNETGSANTLRLDGGVNLTLIPLTYIQLGFSSIGSGTGYTVGLGIKF